MRGVRSPLAARGLERYFQGKVMAEPQDLTIEILKQIRDELVTTRTDLGGRIDELRTELGGRIDQTNARLSAVEGAVLDFAEPQRFVVRHLPR